MTQLERSRSENHCIFNLNTHNLANLCFNLEEGMLDLALPG